MTASGTEVGLASTETPRTMRRPPDQEEQPRGSRPSRTTAVLATAEAIVAVSAALLCVVLARRVTVDPLDRVGQVSGLAALGLHHVVLGLVVLAAVVLVIRAAPGPSGRAAAALGAAAVAGLLTGFVGGGLAIALQGTTWPLFANGGDSGRLLAWAGEVVAGAAPRDDYPPVIQWAIAVGAEATGRPASQVLQWLQVLGAALFGPAAYLAWRLVLRPPWALAMALIAAMPLMDLYKPYANVVLAVLLPTILKVLTVARSAPAHSWRVLAGAGTLAGLALGALFLTYSGWFLWLAPAGLVVALTAVPWHEGLRQAAVLLLTTVATFLLVSGRLLVGLLSAARADPDRFQYFDTATEPAYIAMWRSDMPGPVGPWPPPGELAGMGVFSALLVLGFGVALALGRGRLDVRLLAASVATVWLIRLWLASRMYSTGEVQLYPRTTVALLYCLLGLCVLAAMVLTDRVRHRWWSDATDEPPPNSERPAAPTATAAWLATALLAGLFMASATADRYQPRPDRSAGYLAYVAHEVRLPGGGCPVHAPGGRCHASVAQAELARQEASSR